jgi:hypothetical protein
MEAGTGRTTGPGNTTTRYEGARGLSRYTTETKAAFKTTEFWLTIAAIAGILISASQVKGGPDDEFIASQAWLYVAILVGLYAIGRGAAKSGSNEPYGVDEADNDVRGNTGR